MQCRNCGIEIADKALICYRCGTATTEAKFKPVAPRRAWSRSFVLSLVLLVVGILVAVYADRTTTSGAPHLLTWVAVGIAVVVIGLRAAARRR